MFFLVIISFNGEGGKFLKVCKIALYPLSVNPVYSTHKQDLQDSSSFGTVDSFLSLSAGRELVRCTRCLSSVSTVRLSAGGLVGLSSSADNDNSGIGIGAKSE